jgi:hypothetical protein
MMWGWNPGRAKLWDWFWGPHTLAHWEWDFLQQSLWPLKFMQSPVQKWILGFFSVGKVARVWHWPPLPCSIELYLYHPNPPFFNAFMACYRVDVPLTCLCIISTYLYTIPGESSRVYWLYVSLFIVLARMHFMDFVHQSGLKIRPCFWGRISSTLSLKMVVYF